MHLVPGIKLHIQRHLVVAASSGMQLFSRLSDPVDQRRLHKTVDIFILIRNLKFSALNVA